MDNWRTTMQDVRPSPNPSQGSPDWVRLTNCINHQRSWTPQQISLKRQMYSGRNWIEASWIFQITVYFHFHPLLLTGGAFTMKMGELQGQKTTNTTTSVNRQKWYKEVHWVNVIGIIVLPAIGISLAFSTPLRSPTFIWAVIYCE